MLDLENVGKLFDLRQKLHWDIFKMKELFDSFNLVSPMPYNYISAVIMIKNGKGKVLTSKLRDEICSELNDIRYDIRVLQNADDCLDCVGMDLDHAKFRVDSALERLQTLRCWYLRYKYLGEQK